MSLASKIEIVEKTDTGLQRSYNEDCVGSENSIGLVVLADGMGGHNSGEVASAMAVSHVIDRFKKSYQNLEHGEVNWETGLTQETLFLRDAILKANKEIYAAAEANFSNRGMGTTLVGMLFLNNKVSIAHVGDSRAYRLREGSFELLTEDHSLLQELVRKGVYTREQARLSDQGNFITRALGIDSRLTVDIVEEITAVGDLYLACSDGLTDMVSDDDIHRILQENEEDIETAVDELVLAANENGGRDNISVILSRVTSSFPLEESFADKMLGWFQS